MWAETPWGFFLGLMALNGLLAAVNPGLRHWSAAVLPVVYGILLTLVFVRARIGQKRRNQERHERDQTGHARFSSIEGGHGSQSSNTCLSRLISPECSHFAASSPLAPAFPFGRPPLM